MTVISLVASYAEMAVTYLLPFLAILGLIVVIHEMGHYLIARWCGVGVQAFSFGMGPEIVGLNDRHGTRWKISLIPIGGYVRFAGDDNAASVPRADASPAPGPATERTFNAQSVPKKMAIVAAGPIANFLLAIMIFSAQAYVYGVRLIPPVVAAVMPGSAAESAGLKAGDIITRINDDSIEDFSDILRVVISHPDQQLMVELERGGQTVTLPVTPKRVAMRSPGGLVHVGQLGINSVDSASQKLVHPSAARALVLGSEQTWKIIRDTSDYIGGLFAGHGSADQLSGPIGIAKVSHSAAAFGVGALMQLAAMLSVSLGFMNLLPVPMLDGGHLVVYAIEGLRGRKLDPRLHELGLKIGLAFIMALTIFVTAGDLWRMLFASR